MDQRLAMTLLLLLSACAPATVYESLQGSARQSCDKLLDAREQLECRRQHEIPYEQYRKQRESLSGEAAAQPASN